MKTTTFKVSDKVVCIERFNCTASSVFSEVPEVGKVYCVRGIDTYENLHWGFGPSKTLQHIFLVGITGRQRPVAGGEFSFEADHFRLL
jgi:hypothetical protein